MPILIDFLFAPWRFFSILLGGSSLPPPLPPETSAKIAETSQKAPGFCRSIESGAESFASCHVLGYEMPPLILFASIVILSLFVVSLVWLLHQVKNVHQGLACAAQAVLSNSRPIENEPDLAPLRKAFESQETTRFAWRNFENSLLLPGEHTQGLNATKPIEETLTRASLIDEHLAGSYFALLPGTLTGLGLLMTFVAILDGLSHVTVTAEMDVQGISGLINGLSGKFFSSIVAVFCAVAFVLVERFALQRPEALYRSMIRSLSARLKLKTAEQMLAELLRRRA